MTHSFDGYNHLIRLTKGERLSEVLDQFMNETSLEGAWISGLGGVLEATLGFYDLETKSYQWKTFEGLREIASLTGNLAADDQGKMVFHLHGVFGDVQFKAIAGHVKDLVAGATIEIFVHCAYQPIHRKLDEDTGLQLLSLG